jgi:hypothetical protein
MLVEPAMRTDKNPICSILCNVIIAANGSNFFEVASNLSEEMLPSTTRDVGMDPKMESHPCKVHFFFGSLLAQGTLMGTLATGVESHMAVSAINVVRFIAK